MKITVCKTEMDFPGEVGELRDSSDLLENMDAIHARIGGDGYLLLRNFIDRDDVLVAKEKFRTEIESANAAGNIEIIAKTPNASTIFGTILNNAP